MKLVFASDSFKGSIDSSRAAELLKAAACEVFGEIETVSIPLADGGEGTVDAVLASSDAKAVTVEVHGPLMEPAYAKYALFDDGSSDTAHFTITEPKKDDTKPDSKVPDTSDRGALPALHWLAVMTASLLVMFIALRKRLIHR